MVKYVTLPVKIRRSRKIRGKHTDTHTHSLERHLRGMLLREILETFLMVNLCQKTAFLELETQSQKKIPPKSEKVSLKQLWFQKMWQSQILKPLWFHEN